MDPESFEFPPELFAQVPLFAEIAKAISWTGGPVNWDLARQVAVAMADSDRQTPIIDADREEIADAVRLAQSWLLESIGLPDPGASRAHAINAREWAERALENYPEVFDPFAARFGSLLGGEGGEALEGPLRAVAAQLGPLLMGIQTGTVIGGLSRSLLTGFDIPFPLEEEGSVTILVAHVDAAARETGMDRREFRYWAALHATAHRLCFDGLPWTRTHFFAMYHQYLAEIEVNLGDMVERLQGIDPMNPESIQSLAGEGLLGIGSDAGGAGGGAFRSLLALIEAYTDRAASAAAHGRLPNAGRIAEAAAGRSNLAGGGERLVARFLGVDTVGEQRRTADAFCLGVLGEGGWPLLNTIWEDPDRLPSPSDLADPSAWIDRVG